MRIQPIFNKLGGINKINKTQTQFESKNNSNKYIKPMHSYTGVASVDLAYASLLDDSIAGDLRDMGLI